MAKKKTCKPLDLELLKKQRDILEKDLSKIKKQISKLLIPQYRAEYEKSYTDTYWKLQNGYGGDLNWDCFAHVIAVIDVWETYHGPTCKLVCDLIEERNDGVIMCRRGTKEYGPSIFTTKITKAAFEKKKVAILTKIQGI